MDCFLYDLYTAYSDWMTWMDCFLYTALIDLDDQREFIGELLTKFMVPASRCHPGPERVAQCIITLRARGHGPEPRF